MLGTSLAVRVFRFHKSSARSTASIPGQGTQIPNAAWHQFRSVVSDSLWLHGLQHTRLSCSSQTSGACSYSCPLSWWCHPTISSSDIPFSLSSTPKRNAQRIRGRCGVQKVKKMMSGEFSASPVVRIPHFHCQRQVSILGWGIKISQAMWNSLKTMPHQNTKSDKEMGIRT